MWALCSNVPVEDSYGLCLDQVEAQGSAWPTVNAVEVGSAIHKPTVNPRICMFYVSLGLHAKDSRVAQPDPAQGTLGLCCRHGTGIWPLTAAAPGLASSLAYCYC